MMPETDSPLTGVSRDPIRHGTGTTPLFEPGGGTPEWLVTLLRWLSGNQLYPRGHFNAQGQRVRRTYPPDTLDYGESSESLDVPPEPTRPMVRPVPDESLSGMLDLLKGQAPARPWPPKRRSGLSDLLR